MSAALSGHSVRFAFGALRPSHGNGAYCIKIHVIMQYSLIMKSVMKSWLVLETLEKDENMMISSIVLGESEGVKMRFHFLSGVI